MGTAHWASISRIDDPDQMPHIRCLADIDRTKCAQLAGAFQSDGHEAVEYRDLDTLLDEEAGNLDAVIIATPDWIHHEQTIRCLRAGLHVYCEKPMSNRIESAREMVKVARETGRLLEIGFQRRSNPRYLALRDEIVARHHGLGRLSHAYAQWHRGILGSQPLQVAEHPSKVAMARKAGYGSYFEMRNWRILRKYGSGVMDCGAHQIDLINYVFQAVPKRIVGLGGVDYWTADNPRGHYEMPDKVLAHFEYDIPPHLSPDGKPHSATASLELLTTNGWQQFFERFHGDQATVEISEIPQRNRIAKEVATYTEVTEEEVKSLADFPKLADQYEHRRFLRAHQQAWKKMLAEGLIYRVPSNSAARALKPWESSRIPKDPPPYLKTPYDLDEERRGRRYLPIDIEPSDDLSEYRLGQNITKPAHQYHLLNFLDAVRTGDRSRLRCPPEEGFRTCVTALKTLEAIETGRAIDLRPEDYVA